jgi:uncharacterized phiE125 gp8 family phage protein
MSLTLIAPPAAEPVSVAELKSHLKVDGSAEDALIAGYILAARQAVESRFGVAIIQQGWRLALDAAPKGVLILPLAPVIAIDSVGVKRAGVIEALSPDAYEAEAGATGRLRLKGCAVTGGRLGGIVIAFTAGWPDVASVPGELKYAIRTLAAHYYENRENGPDPRGAAAIAALLAPYRQVRL